MRVGNDTLHHIELSAECCFVTLVLKESSSHFELGGTGHLSYISLFVTITIIIIIITTNVTIITIIITIITTFISSL